MAPPTEDRTDVGRELFFAVLATVSIFIGISRFADPDPAPLWLRGLDVLIALLFAGDWVLRVAHSRRPARYAMLHAYEVLTFIPFTLLGPELAGGDVLRGARFLRLVRLARFGAIAKLTLGLARLPRRLRYVQRVARHAQILTILVVGVLLVAAGAAALLLAEGSRNAGIQGYGGALWWALSLFTTVSYAVPAPATPTGYAVSSVIMVLGVGYIGVFTASLASALLRTPDEE